MTMNEYNALPRAAARARDAEIKAALGAWPTYVPEWDEYACRSSLTGDIYYGSTSREALARMMEAELVWAQHREV